MDAQSMTMMDHILNQALVFRLWVFWLMIVNTASLLFVFRHVPARWVLLAWVINMPLMNYLYETYGFVRLLGLSHVLVWTPVLIYLGRQWTSFDRRTLFGAWVTVLIVTNGISLAFDYVDVVRYFAGDGALPQ